MNHLNLFIPFRLNPKGIEVRLISFPSIEIHEDKLSHYFLLKFFSPKKFFTPPSLTPSLYPIDYYIVSFTPIRYIYTSLSIKYEIFVKVFSPFWGVKNF